MAPIHVQIGGQEDFSGNLTINKDIEQNIHLLETNYEKYQKLHDLLQKLCMAGQ